MFLKKDRKNFKDKLMAAKYEQVILQQNELSKRNWISLFMQSETAKHLNYDTKSCLLSIDCKDRKLWQFLEI